MSWAVSCQVDNRWSCQGWGGDGRAPTGMTRSKRSPNIRTPIDDRYRSVPVSGGWLTASLIHCRVLLPYKTETTLAMQNDGRWHASDITSITPCDISPTSWQHTFDLNSFIFFFIHSSTVYGRPWPNDIRSYKLQSLTYNVSRAQYSGPCNHVCNFVRRIWFIWITLKLVQGS